MAGYFTPAYQEPIVRSVEHFFEHYGIVNASDIRHAGWSAIIPNQFDFRLWSAMNRKVVCTMDNGTTHQVQNARYTNSGEYQKVCFVTHTFCTDYSSEWFRGISTLRSISLRVY